MYNSKACQFDGSVFFQSVKIICITCFDKRDDFLCYSYLDKNTTKTPHFTNNSGGTCISVAGGDFDRVFESWGCQYDDFGSRMVLDDGTFEEAVEKCQNERYGMEIFS